MDALIFDESLKKILFLFRYGGLSLESRTRTTVQKVKTRLLYIFNSSWLNVDVVGGIYWFVDGLNHEKKFIELTYTAPCLALASMANVKSLVTMFNEQRIDELIDSLRSLEMISVNSDRVERKKIAEDEKSFLYGVIKMLKVVNVVLVLTFSLSPMILMLVKYMKTEELELKLIFFVIYPFDSYDIRYWPIAYAHQFWSECIVVMHIYSADFFFFTCCSHIRTQFLLLADDLENIIPDLANNVQQTADLDFKKKFQDIIRRHQGIIGAATLLEAIYTKPTLWNFTTSSILICLSGFNVMANEDVAVIVNFMLFLFMCLLQVFFLCFFGDMLMRSSTTVSNALYSSRWYSAEPGIAKSCLIVLIRAQKPCKLTAMGFADVNLMAFTSVLSTSWSYFCLLNTMYTPSTA